MTRQTEFKNWLIGEMQKGHKHEKISEKLACNQCGERFNEVKRVYDRETKKNPELVKRPDKFKRSEEYAVMATKLADRVKRDPLYKKHLWLSSFGTPEEKALEAKRANEGFYKKHSEYGKRYL